MLVRLLDTLFVNPINIPLRRFAFEGGIPDVAALPDLMVKELKLAFFRNRSTGSGMIRQDATYTVSVSTLTYHAGHDPA